ncbi:SEC-C metal-binding domain-containing protein [Paraburkholderia phenoliruptrix]|uniref:SEC-C metal-binding domain-containing protein n=1 Tax=Paraburkholderia phenoliruptrix TaxID=252970 RepID=UPI003D96BFDE
MRPRRSTCSNEQEDVRTYLERVGLGACLWLRKIGRNERCPCGSGKEYKHCHGWIVPEPARRLFHPG